jgi:hypothetical protein
METLHRLSFSLDLTLRNVAQSNARTSLLVGGNEYNARSLKRFLNSDQCIHHGSETILESAHRISGNARLLSQVAYAPPQGRSRHPDLRRRDHEYDPRKALVDTDPILEYIVLQN